MSFPASTSQDVIGYNLYVEEHSNPVTYLSSLFNLGKNTSVILNTILPKNIDGIYNIGVTAVDAVGNESDMSILSDVPLDFVAPSPPGVITIS